MPFPYYSRLSRGDKAIYRKSDQVGRIEVPDVAEARPIAEAIRAGLAADDRSAVEPAAARLLRVLCGQLGVPNVSVRVLDVRPSDASSELHGLYVREEGTIAVIHVWMRTAARKNVVAYRTFLRTLLHELCHHLDYEHLGLLDSFHTEGFFKRESALVRDLAGASKKAKASPKDAAREESTGADAPSSTAKQLGFGF